MLDATHDPSLRSWVESANDPQGDFPIQNLPLGRYRDAPGERWQIGVAIGDDILNLRSSGLLATDEMQALLVAPPAVRRELRGALSEGLRRGSARESAWRKALVPRSSVELGLPCEIRGFTDFYSGIHHATAVGRIFRPENPLLPNYKWVPIAYHGRSSSIQPSGHSFPRPRGQVKRPESEAPTLSLTRRLDYELELGLIIGQGNALGEPVHLDDAESHVVGLTLLNDWSARDVQTWEYQPLGPFLAKNFATTLSPWIVTLEALAPFRQPFRRPSGDPSPLPYLDSASNREAGVVAIELEVWLETERMRGSGEAALRLSRSNYRDAYWTMAQLVAHHTVNGCNLETGDLLGTGTLSGPAPGQGGSMLEQSAGGKQPIRLPNGETRAFVEDGDTIIFKGFCEREGFRRIGFGECRATVVAAPPY
ncbi:MAG TPA: fumarylacetoacetase [Steroidobacteraceae bacterium]|nr:fumarylacetoacetase [Steroidobacteraceae bacterium]